MRAIRVASLHQGDRSVCPCGAPVEYDEIDGWQHADGSISHDGELSGKSVSDLIGAVSSLKTAGAAGENFQNLRFIHKPDEISAHHPIHGLVGKVIFEDSGANNPVYIHDISVPHHKRRGVATSLMNEMEQRFTGRIIDHGLLTSDGKAWSNHYYGPDAARWNEESNGWEGLPTKNRKVQARVNEKSDGRMPMRGKDYEGEVGNPNHITCGEGTLEQRTGLVRKQAMPWNQRRPGETAQAMQAKSVRDAGFKGFVGSGEEPVDDDDDEPDHVDEHLHHFVMAHGNDDHEWKRHEPQPVSVNLSHGVYATQSHVSQKHINKYLDDLGAQTHMGHPDSGYLGDEHPMFVTHNGELHVTEGHHRVGAALQRGQSSMMGWHYNLDDHPVAQVKNVRIAGREDCEDCKWHNGGDDDDEMSHEGSKRTARFIPDKRVFTHTCGLDHRLFDGEHLRPEVRSDVLGRFTAFCARRGYREWSRWGRLVFFGSEASEWTSMSLEGNGDFDLSLGVNYPVFRECNPAYTSMIDQEIADMFTQQMHADLNDSQHYFTVVL